MAMRRTAKWQNIRRITIIICITITGAIIDSVDWHEQLLNASVTVCHDRSLQRRCRRCAAYWCSCYCRNEAPIIRTFGYGSQARFTEVTLSPAAIDIAASSETTELASL